MEPKIVTVGVYGATEEGFFRALSDAGVDTFCDIRLRRGMRGPTYAFVNSARLQQKLSDMGIRYLHLKELAPSQAIRDRQRDADEALGVGKQSRDRLGHAFVEAYNSERLGTFDGAEFLRKLGPSARTVALFCVEREPQACHRSLVAIHLHEHLGLPIEHLQA